MKYKSNKQRKAVMARLRSELRFQQKQVKTAEKEIKARKIKELELAPGKAAIKTLKQRIRILNAGGTVEDEPIFGKLEKRIRKRKY